MSQEIEQQGLAAALAGRSNVQITEYGEERMHECPDYPECYQIWLPLFTKLYMSHEELTDLTDYVREFDAFVAPVPANRVGRECRSRRRLSVVWRESDASVT